MTRWRNKILNGIITGARNGPIGLEVWLAITALRWAIYMVLPPTVLHNNTTATMALMETFAPAWLWSVAFLMGAVGQAWSSLGRHYRARSFFALTGVFWWLMVSLMDALQRVSTVTINIATFALGQIIVYMLLVIAYDPREEII